MAERENTSLPPQQPMRVPRGLSLEQAHEFRRDRAILEMQENIRALTAQIQQLINQPRGRDREPPQDPPDGPHPFLDSDYGRLVATLLMEMFDLGEEELIGMISRTSK